MEEYKHHIDTHTCVCVCTRHSVASVGVVVKGGEVFKQPPPLSDGRRCPACLFICTRWFLTLSPIQAGAAYRHRRLQLSVSSECEVWGHPQGLPGSAAAGHGTQSGCHRGQLPRRQHVQGPRDVHPSHLRCPLRVWHGREFSPIQSEDGFNCRFTAAASPTFPFAVPRRSLATRWACWTLGEGSLARRMSNSNLKR